MTTAIELLIQSRQQKFVVDLAGTFYGLKLRWLAGIDPCWVVDIFSGSGQALVLGLPLLPGVDALKQHRHLGIKGGLYIKSGIKASYDNLGDKAKLYFLPDNT